MRGHIVKEVVVHDAEKAMQQRGSKGGKQNSLFVETNSTLSERTSGENTAERGKARQSGATVQFYRSNNNEERKKRGLDSCNEDNNQQGEAETARFHRAAEGTHGIHVLVEPTRFYTPQPLCHPSSEGRGWRGGCTVRLRGSFLWVEGGEGTIGERNRELGRAAVEEREEQKAK